MKKLLIFLGVLFIAGVAFGQSPSPSIADIVGAGSMSIWSWALAAWKLSKDVNGLGVAATLAAVVNLLINLTKTTAGGNFFHKLGDSAQILLLLGLSALVVGLTGLAQGASLVACIEAVGQSSAGAMFLHEAYQRLVVPALTKVGASVAK